VYDRKLSLCFRRNVQPPSSMWLNYVYIYAGVIWRGILPGRFFITMNLYVAGCSETFVSVYRVADKSLALPGRKQATAIRDFDAHISYLLS